MLPLNHVVGIGYGRKIKNNRPTEEDAIVIMVDKKLPEEQLERRDLVPQKLENIITDVQEIGTLKLLNKSRSIKYRPAPGGVSIGHYKISAGTLGAIVKDKKTGEPLILSNNHVLANITDGRDGRAKSGDAILQPGSHDKGSSDDVIGHLERFIPLKPSKGIFNSPTNIVDCAVAKPTNKNLVENNILGIGKINGVKEAEININVIKSGRTTGVTEGTVRAIDSTVTVNIGEDREAIFTDQIVTSPISQGGDSGSLVLDKDRNAIGLLFAGSNEATICNKISNVMQELKIDFFNEESAKNEEDISEQYKNHPSSNIFLILILLVLGIYGFKGN